MSKPFKVTFQVIFHTTNINLLSFKAPQKPKSLIAIYEHFSTTRCQICQCLLINKRTLSICDYCFPALPFLSKQSCLKCGSKLHNLFDEICGACVSKPPLWDTFHASVIYVSPIKEILTKAKFHNKHLICKQIAHLMYEINIKNNNFLKPSEDYLFIPTPLHESRLKQRGYNQSLLICKELSKLTKIPFIDCLSRTNHTPPQSSLSRQERLQSKPSFTVKRKQTTILEGKLHPLKNKHAIIIDDVFTTGSTVKELSSTIKTFGFSTIKVWVFARTC